MALPSTTDTGSGASTTGGSTTGSSPNTTSTGSTSTTAPPAGSATPGLSQGLTAVLRKIVSDPNFRAQFGADPVLAITSSCIAITGEDLAKLESLTPDQLDQLAQGIGGLGSAAAGASGLKAEGTHTLLYAILVAAALARQ